MSDFYELPNSTNDFKSRSNNVFDQLVNLEKQHDIQKTSQSSLVIADDETPSVSTQNPSIPANAIVFRKRPSDQTTFSRPTNKWKKYDLDDVNEHHISETGNRRALDDFFRTRVKIPESKIDEETDESTSAGPIFKRPMKKEILTNEDDEADQQFISIRVPKSTTNETKSKHSVDDNDGMTAYKLKSTPKKTRGVLSTTKKVATKVQMEIGQAEDDDEDDDAEDDIELFEP